MTFARTTSLSALLWCVLVGAWSLVFAAPHFYWAAGGRAGLGAQAGAADAALQQSWFAVYNLAAGALGIIGAAVAGALAMGWGGQETRRRLVIAAAAAGVVLLLRGALGITLLAVSAVRGTFDEQTAAILLAIEPWFIVGGFAYGGMALNQRKPSPASVSSE